MCVCLSEWSILCPLMPALSNAYLKCDFTAVLDRLRKVPFKLILRRSICDWICWLSACDISTVRFAFTVFPPRMNIVSFSKSKSSYLRLLTSPNLAPVTVR